jgi:hypothetical protein
MSVVTSEVYWDDQAEVVMLTLYGEDEGYTIAIPDDMPIVYLEHRVAELRSYLE